MLSLLSMRLRWLSGACVVRHQVCDTADDAAHRRNADQDAGESFPRLPVHLLTRARHVGPFHGLSVVPVVGFHVRAQHRVHPGQVTAPLCLEPVEYVRIDAQMN
jgi:hypothetical protein